MLHIGQNLSISIQLCAYDICNTVFWNSPCDETATPLTQMESSTPGLQNRLQKKGNVSDTQVEKEEGENWRVAMIDQATERRTAKEAANKVDVPEVEQEGHSHKEPVDRLEAVRDAFRHAWKGYKEFAWGKDEHAKPRAGS